MPGQERPKIESAQDFAEKNLITWRAHTKPFKKLNRNQWTRLIIFCSLFSVILFIAEGAIPILLIIAVIFFFYVLSTVEFQEIEYSLTTRGVKISGGLIGWNEIRSFHFGKSFGNDVIMFDTNRLVASLSAVLDPAKAEDIRTILIKYIPENTPPITSADKISGWFSKKILGN